MKNYRDELVEGMKKLTKDGFKCYIRGDNDYGFIITPSDNVLYIQPEYFGGWSTSFAYVPSKNNGSACQCLENPFFEINTETLLQCEKEGTAFAYRLGAKRYKNSQEYINSYLKFWKEMPKEIK